MMRFFLALFVILSGVAQAQAPLADARAAVRSGDLASAITILEAIAVSESATKAERAAALVNLGYCLEARGEPVAALLFWRRALRLAPADGDLAQRVVDAEAELGAETAEGELTISDLERLARPETVYWLVPLQILLLGFFLGVRKQSVWRPVMALALILTLFLAGRIVWTSLQREAEEAQVMQDTLLFVEPHEKTAVAGELRAGAVVEVLQSSRYWTLVETELGASWVKSEKLEVIP